MDTQQSSSSPSSIDGASSLVSRTVFLAASSNVVLFPSILILLGVTVLWNYLRRRQSREAEERSGKKLPQSARSGDGGSLLDVWAERQRRGIGPPLSASSGRGTKLGDKPFGSKYYYAHNNPSSTGGYKDGLRMEDYAMNGPRLLARNGVAMPSRTDSEGASEALATASNTTAGQKPTEQDAASVRKANIRRIVPVTQYLWDDPGNGTGTIRVDHLPHPTQPGEKRSWKDSGVESVRACLVSGDCGLEVVMEASAGGASSGDIEYRLSIPKLYGPVSAVTTVTKPSRLLIKLEKRTTFLDRSNARQWPHPQKKLLYLYGGRFPFSPRPHA